MSHHGDADAVAGEQEWERETAAAAPAAGGARFNQVARTNPIALYVIISSFV